MKAGASGSYVKLADLRLRASVLHVWKLKTKESEVQALQNQEWSIHLGLKPLTANIWPFVSKPSNYNIFIESDDSSLWKSISIYYIWVDSSFKNDEFRW